MKKKIRLLVVLLLLCSLYLRFRCMQSERETLTAAEAHGTRNQFRINGVRGMEGVRVTVVKAEDGTPVNTPLIDQ